jgi:curved DNA-binding protein CbpA
MSDDTHYDVLGVGAEAPRDEIRAAYRAKVDALREAREAKGVSSSKLAENRESVARLNTAWNVLSDPYQRGRYDQGLETAADGEPADAAAGPDAGETTPAVRPTGWRRVLAPPPPRDGATGGRRAARGRTRPQTVVLPSGMQLADQRSRGMAALLDIAIVMVIVLGTQFMLPRIVRSDYSHLTDRISTLTKARDHANSLADTASSAEAKAKAKVRAAVKAGDSAAQAAAQSDVNAAKAKVTAQHKKANADDAEAKRLNRELQPTVLVAEVVALALALLYLVPLATRTGQTFGMRGRGVRIVGVNGGRVGWYPIFTRFAVPLACAIGVPSFGPVVGLGMVLWAYRDPNGQGLHDKLAKTLVVSA